MALDTENAAALLAERGPGLPAAPVLAVAGEDLLVVRDDLGEGCHTLVPARAPIPEWLRGLPVRSRATGELVGVARRATYPDGQVVEIYRQLAEGESAVEKVVVEDKKGKRRPSGHA